MKKNDVIVLGAGIVGVSVALHLAARGRAVTLVDRRGPGEETSYGNAGLIERASVIPYAFPRDLRSLLRYALNNRPDVRYHPGFLPRVAPWLARYWWHSAPSRLARAAQAMLPLIERSVVEHDALKDEAGIAGLFRRTGWIDGARSQAGLDQAAAEAASLSSYGLKHQVLDRQALAALEPALSERMVGAVHWLDPVNVSDPGAVTRGYAALLQRRGGVFANGDARSLRQDGGGWRVDTADGPLRAREAVVALGPWSTDVLGPLGYRVPMAVKRGYHQHFALERGAALTRPVADIDNGFVMTPMTLGLRLTTGAEFASRDAPPTPVQIGRVRALAEQLVPLGAAVEAQPWMGCRPCMPDMRPVIGPAPNHPGLWLSFGHAHHGFTLGPVTGRLLASLITGEAPDVDPAPYALRR
ncbi:FAD-binding oxidoreductase [Achromobacter sp. Marseille-Q0513]|uniref:NAD(P)/FAD-dependent oxidoreductase n=1 Tax=Achromobacter sp. Marseille-Q0513 TaxID=2829161 RepID=UPI001B93FAB9|nr:FAD-binding oxidoreductase [Achromobacter sp. Marseille-Q0513]MBR8656864.1 FAD-binding oxidoreductase [Achromobacter sp. Marseille-Q0513]